MEAKLVCSQLDCWNKSFETLLRKEETVDSVVPDTLPDADELLCVSGSLLIRSKDLSSGRAKLEANIPAKVLFRDEQGAIHSMELNVPVYLSVESESISEGDTCTAELRLLNLETRLLNPRKVFVKAEVAAQLCCYRRDSVQYAVSVESAEHIHTRCSTGEIGYISAVGEKTFALSDEQPLPPELEEAEILGCNMDCLVDETKQLGSKLIVKGRIQSHLLLMSASGLRPLELSTDFSQIVECGPIENALVRLWLSPSGAYHYISADGDSRRVCMEFHLVAQHCCHERRELDCLSDAYSNAYELNLSRLDMACDMLQPGPGLRSSCRQLDEVRDASEILCCIPRWGTPRREDGKVLLPVTARCIYSDTEGRPAARNISAELSFEADSRAGERLIMLDPELTDCSAAMMPGGIELRVSARADSLCSRVHSFGCIATISYDEDSPLDLSKKPSLTLLRASSSDELWTLARENCSTESAIMDANHLKDLDAPWEKLIIIPKTI